MANKTPRILRADFVQFMQRREALPTAQRIEEWLKQHAECKTGQISKLFKCEPLDRRYAVRFVFYVTSHARKGTEQRCFKAFCEYLQQFGIDNPLAHSDDNIADILLEPDPNNYFISPTEKFLSSLKLWRIAEKYIIECRKDSQVKHAVDWLFIDAGRQIAANESLSRNDAIHIAEKAVGLSIQEYRERALAWSRFDSLTVIQARGKGHPTGMCIVLPLQEAVYEEIKAGKRVTHDVLPTELKRPSRFILTEACFVRPVDQGGLDGSPTKYVLKAVASQIAILSHSYRPELKLPIHMLSFGGTPDTERLLRSDRYKPTRTRMPKTNWPLFEGILPWSSLHPTDYLFRMALLWIGADYDKRLELPPDADDQATS